MAATNWLLKHGKRVLSVHALARSKIVRMGVAVANVALGGRVVVHGTRAPFEVGLRAIVDAR